MEWAQVLRRQVRVKKTAMILKPVMLGHLGFPLALLFGLKTQQHLIDCWPLEKGSKGGAQRASPWRSYISSSEEDMDSESDGANFMGCLRFRF